MAQKKLTKGPVVRAGKTKLNQHRPGPRGTGVGRSRKLRGKG